MKHGDITRHGDEFNHDDMAFCEKCGRSHTLAYKACDGLRGPPPTAEVIQQWREARGVNANHTATHEPGGRVSEFRFGSNVKFVEPPSALGHQEGGDHYKALKIQPIEFIHANGIPFAEGCVIKYVTRWRAKNGVADLKKARHFLDLLIELEEKTHG